MNDNQAKYPQLRFKGFTDPWEERKLGDEVLIVMGQSPNSENYTDNPNDHILVQGNADMKNGHVFPRVWTTQVTKQAEKNDLILSVRAPVGDIGKTDYDVVIGRGVAAIKGNEFIFQNLGKMKSDGYWTRYGTGSTFESINSSDIKEAIISIPRIEEQQKIGSFFKQLDNTIAANQRKLDLLKEQKKGYLQKMFPKNGAKVPELRFAGFADDWEERKLSDVANHRGGTAIEKYFDKDGVYKVISIGSYGLNSQYVDQNIRAISNDITDGRVVNSGELTMVLNDKTANGTIIGRSLLVEQDNEYVINQRTEIISPKETFDSNFAYTILNGPFRKKVKRIVQGGTQIYVNYPAVSNLYLELPKIEEQQKIGSFFKQLDNLITLHQRKLDLLKEQKKGFLQKMFV
ncbi:restriction endonuclease subunit S [Levilactobacillus brevis]|uniref:restriction endonuclease subunit S n=1 Tax=Lactobacillaceae TaxID=33958 RepID=UPI001C1F13A9|nr:MULTISPECIES: restriction endonuclease subunit S [Lactobacillaceae]MBU7540607.1 restriction endonuclease subunit S [Levilactobacillus brevis]MBU7566714.1 restriction endonuclease subunit S [Levilactobacillus brevis]MCE6021090.1 restriction endonuclease subunit S [Levilactobacillus brevis]MCE6028592.1 restriction endonuclease subunit S [Levilactobacillus brevis]MCE6031993.1 restriction endonuclease subunit S [Lactiplantibacillus pentosus]